MKPSFWKITLGILLFLLLVMPFVPLVLWSFSAGWRWPDLWPETFALRAWEYVLSPTAGTGSGWVTSLQIAFAVTGCNLILALPAANAIARYRFRGKGWVEALLYAPIVIPPFVSIMGIHLTFIRLNLTESLTGVVLAHLIPTLPYMVRALVVSFQTLDQQWENQARMLGATGFQRLLHVVWPHLLPGVITGASLCVLVSLSQYLITLLIGGGEIQTLSLLLFPFISGGDPAIGAAYSLVFAGAALTALWSMEWLLRRHYRSITE